LKGIRERPDQEPERSDQIRPIRIVDNGSETVHRLEDEAEYLDPAEAKALVRGRFAEGVGLEPTSPFGQRFSSPLMAFSPNVANLPANPFLAGQKEEGDFLVCPAVAVCF
jgi:hypothetical protein